MVWPVPLPVGSSWRPSSILTRFPRCLWPNSFRKVQQFSWLCMVLPLSECGPYRRFSNSSSSWTLLTPFANLLSLAKSHSKGKTEHGDHPVVLWATSQTYIIPSLWLLLFALFWRARQALTICENWPQESENGGCIWFVAFYFRGVRSQALRSLICHTLQRKTILAWGKKSESGNGIRTEGTTQRNSQLRLQ